MGFAHTSLKAGSEIKLRKDARVFVEKVKGSSRLSFDSLLASGVEVKLGGIYHMYCEGFTGTKRVAKVIDPKMAKESFVIVEELVF